MITIIATRAKMGGGMTETQWMVPGRISQRVIGIVTITAIVKVITMVTGREA